MVSRNNHKAALKMMIAAEQSHEFLPISLFSLRRRLRLMGRSANSEAAHQCIEIAPWSASNSHQVSQVRRGPNRFVS